MAIFIKYFGVMFYSSHYVRVYFLSNIANSVHKVPGWKLDKCQFLRFGVRYATITRTTWGIYKTTPLLPVYLTGDSRGCPVFTFSFFSTLWKTGQVQKLTYNEVLQFRHYYFQNLDPTFESLFKLGTSLFYHSFGQFYCLVFALKKQ